MINARNLRDSKVDPQVLTVTRLSNLYDETTEQLRQCASRSPNSDPNEAMAELRETALLDFEADLLSQSANIQLKSKDDIQQLMDIWMKVSGIESDSDPRPSDRIAMNIFRHIVGDRFNSD